MLLIAWSNKLDRKPVNGALWSDEKDVLDQARALWATGGCSRISIYLLYEPDPRARAEWNWVRPHRPLGPYRIARR